LLSEVVRVARWASCRSVFLKKVPDRGSEWVRRHCRAFCFYARNSRPGHGGIHGHGAETHFRKRKPRIRLDRGRCNHRWMLKTVSGWGGEQDSGLISFCVLGGAARTPEFRRSGLQAAIAAARIAAWRPLLQDNSRIFVQPATGQEHRPQPDPHKPSPPESGTHFSIPNTQMRARSPRPRSDNHRSRNPFIALEHMPNTQHGQEDLKPKPDATHLTPRSFRPAP